MLTSANPNSLSLRRSALWVGVAVVGLLLVVAEATFERYQQAALDRWRADIVELRRVDDSTVRWLQAIRQQWALDHGGKDPTLTDAEAMLNGGKPFATDPVGDVHYVEPTTGGHARLWLHERTTWIGVLRTNARALPPRPTYGDVALALAILRRSFWVTTLLLWVALFVRFLAQDGHDPRPLRARSAKRLLGVAGLVAALTFVELRANLAWDVVRRSPYGLLAVASVCGSLIIFAWAHRKPKAFDPGRCRQCGYDLTGNVSGVCPECGRHVGPSVATPKELENLDRKI